MESIRAEQQRQILELQQEVARLTEISRQLSLQVERLKLELVAYKAGARLGALPGYCRRASAKRCVLLRYAAVLSLRGTSHFTRAFATRLRCAREQYVPQRFCLARLTALGASGGSARRADQSVGARAP
jgi:hypothetical protein